MVQLLCVAWQQRVPWTYSFWWGFLEDQHSASTSFILPWICSAVLGEVGPAYHTNYNGAVLYSNYSWSACYCHIDGRNGSSARTVIACMFIKNVLLTGEKILDQTHYVQLCEKETLSMIPSKSAAFCLLMRDLSPRAWFNSKTGTICPPSIAISG